MWSCLEVRRTGLLTVFGTPNVDQVRVRSGTRGGNGWLRYRLHVQLTFIFHEIEALAQNYIIGLV